MYMWIVSKCVISNIKDKNTIAFTLSKDIKINALCFWKQTCARNFFID